MSVLVPGVDYTNDAAGNYAFNPALIGDVVTVQYQATQIAVSALAQLGLGLQPGVLGQGVWGYLATAYPAQAIGYSGLAYVFSAAYDLGDDASVENHSFEVQTPWAITAAGDADPAEVARDLLTNARYGANFPSSRIGAIVSWSAYARSAGLMMSPVILQQRPAAEWLRYLLDLSNTEVLWSQAQLKFVPLGDAAIAGNGASFAPNTTPVYDLTEDHFLCESAEDDPVVLERRPDADVYNHLRVEFTNRANQYNTEVAEAKDGADIERRGLRTKDTIEAHAICELGAASALAQLLLQREMTVRNVYKFRLPWTFSLLEPLDLVTVTDPNLGLTRVPVRINKITERDDGALDFEGEDCPIGMASAPAYGTQASAGFAHDYQAAPGSVATPFFFEPPVQLTTTGLEVWTAVSGLTSMWGGCRVWASADGVSYKEVGKVRGGARYGALRANLGTLAGDTLGLSLAGQGGTLLSGSAAAAQQLQTLLFVGDANGGEFLAYQTATLVGVNAYNLTGLVRGAYYSTPVARNANQATVVRVDEAIAKSGPLQTSQVGKKLWFKFTSFNVYGGGEESLADVAAYTYTPSGYMLRLPPPPPAWFTFDGTRFSWPAVDYPRSLLAGYEIRFQYGTNQSYVDAIPLQADVITSNPYIAPVVPQGPVTFMLRAVDVYGNRSQTGPLVAANLGDATTTNVLQTADYRAAGWPGTITGVASVVGGNIVAANAASALGSPAQSAFSAVASDPAFQSSFAGISYATPQFVPALPGKMTLLHTVAASQFQVNYRPANPAPVFSVAGTSAVFTAGAAAPMFTGVPAWQPWPGSVQVTVQPYEFQIVCGVGAQQQQISRLIAQVDVPDINLKLSGVAIAAGGGTRLAGAAGKFTAITNVNLTLQGGSTAVSAQFLDRSSSLGPLVVCLNAAGAQVAGTVDALIQGY